MKHPVSISRVAQGGGLIAVALMIVLPALFAPGDNETVIPEGRREVVFWHFWGGRDRVVVEEIVERFNASQQEHYVRAVAMPGANLDLKFFLSVTGGDPPDLLNQDDPVVADWAVRGALTPLEQLATAAEMAELRSWLFPAATALGSYNNRLYALCNGLDVRALYYNQRVLEEVGRAPPTTIEELDEIARLVAPPGEPGRRRMYGYVPDSRRLWAWGIVFGGRFYDSATGQITADSEPVVRALEWMASYSEIYGADALLAFRQGDQALTGAAFPVLEGRYAMLMDGQWRVREVEAAVAAAQDSGRTVPRIGVVPLPKPEGGLSDAGWVNGNFFVVPQGCKNPAGAWQFMKFWSGFGGNEAEAARACVAGGWIPASSAVVDQPVFQRYLEEHPDFATFVHLASSSNQVPWPAIPVAQYYDDQLREAAMAAMYQGADPKTVLQEATRRVQQRLDEVLVHED